ncbi:MAG: outer membrane lipoprotein-sorting protein [Gammaproteobacteria bacterium]|nr:outer membrane lipoprotein-sorting protein [Gammaproteobacteria bacterium]
MNLYPLARNTLIALLAVAAANAAFGQTPEERGLEIAKEVEARDEGFGDSSSVLTMILRNRHGQEVTRQMKSRALEVADDGDKSMIIFEDPADVKGTALLTFSHKVDDDDQWLYLPALKRVKRISSSNKSGPFMGSEFAYEDLSSQEVEKYTYKYLRDETVDGTDYFVIERFPVDKKSGYTRQVVWIDQDEYRVRKIDFYDRKASHLKTLELEQYQRYLDKYWRPLRMHMVNHQTGKSTVLTWAEYKFRNGFSDSDFNRNSLQKAR